MKKMFTMLMMAMMALAFTSCEDEAIAYDLEGTWRGEMQISSKYNGRIYNSTYTEITFDRNPYEYAGGSGTWVDYYDDAGWGSNYVANHITWEVSNRVIRIWFRNERTYMEIHDYSLNDSRFEGTIYEDDHYVDFWMRKIARPSSYSSYRWDYYDYDYYWARTRAERGDSAEVKDMPIRFLNPKEE